MASDQTERSNPSVDDGLGDELDVLRISPRRTNQPVYWQLPPSKSHLIRAMALFSQTNQKVILENVYSPGEDVRAMRACLIQMGIQFDDYDSEDTLLRTSKSAGSSPHPDSVKWVVHGVGPHGFNRPLEPLNAANSGTALRFLAGFAARMEGPVVLDGDQSLRSRNSDELWDSLRQAGVTVSIQDGVGHLPAIVSGPWKKDNLGSGIHLDISKSSQPLSSWILSSTSLPSEMELRLNGQGVSNRHASLTIEMANQAGANIEINQKKCVLGPWKPVCESGYIVPGDASMASFAALAAYCLESKIQLHGWPKKEDAIGHEILQESSIEYGISWDNGVLDVNPKTAPAMLDVTNSNDILPPMCALLALSCGGRIVGGAHAAHKESNRLEKTAELLSYFGIDAKVHQNGIEVIGNQRPTKPKSPVPTFGDHRLFMTAVLLASHTGGDIIGQSLHHVADELFIQRLIDAGIGIEAMILNTQAD